MLTLYEKHAQPLGVLSGLSRSRLGRAAESQVVSRTYTNRHVISLNSLLYYGKIGAESKGGTKYMTSIAIEEEIRRLATEYAAQLREKIDQRVEEMEDDDRSHFLAYRVLGITDEEGHLIDVYQNKEQFLYRYAEAFLEDAAKLCFQEKYSDADSVRIPNTLGRRPKTFVMRNR